MKITKRLKLLVGLLFFLSVVGLNAQESGNKNVVTQEREVLAFKGIDAGGSLDVFLMKGESFLVKVETDENFQDKVTTEVNNDILKMKSKGIKNPTKLNAYITLPELIYLKAGGATNVTGESLFETDEMEIIVSGATSVKMDIDVEYLESATSGAADLTLSGKAGVHKVSVSGAGSLKAKSLVSEKATYTVSGAGDAFLNITGELEGTTSGAADVRYIGDPKTTVMTKKESPDKHSNYYTYSYPDSTKVKIGGLNIEVYEGHDSVKVVIGNRELHVDEYGNVRFGRTKKKKFNGHWAGFEMGLNGYFNSDYNMSFPKETEYMDLRTTKSWAVHINFFEQNISLAKNQKWGLVTGLGTSWNNYRFSKDTRLNADSSELIGYIDKGISIRKSKLTAWYFNIPLLFEFQTNRYHKKNSFHLAAGMVMGVRISSHTKKYYNEYNKTFDVILYNPDTDNYETIGTYTSPNYSKEKSFDDFYLNPFKWDATVRIGWGFINLFATYSVNSMFKKDKGPELYPWTVGITFVNF